jgi:hypothetical protein
MFFFEKKNQKTFLNPGRGQVRRRSPIPVVGAKATIHALRTRRLSIIMIGRIELEKALLFLQKKQQKNSPFPEALAPAGQQPAISKSFLLLFFKKEALSFRAIP